MDWGGGGNIQAGVTEYPPRVGGWPSVALNPAETRVTSALNCWAI